MARLQLVECPSTSTYRTLDSSAELDECRVECHLRLGPNWCRQMASLKNTIKMVSWYAVVLVRMSGVAKLVLYSKDSHTGPKMLKLAFA